MRFTGIFCYALHFSAYLKIRAMYCFCIEKNKLFLKFAQENIRAQNGGAMNLPGGKGKWIRNAPGGFSFGKKTRHPIPCRWKERGSRLGKLVDLGLISSFSL